MWHHDRADPVFDRCGGESGHHLERRRADGDQRQADDFLADAEVGGKTHGASETHDDDLDHQR